MKKRFAILKVIGLALLLCNLAACTKHYITDNKPAPKYKYRNAGRAW